MRQPAEDLRDGRPRRSPCLITPSPYSALTTTSPADFCGSRKHDLGQPVGHHRRSDAVELEDLQVALLDDHAAARRRAARAADRANREAERIAQGEGGAVWERIRTDPWGVGRSIASARGDEPRLATRRRLDKGAWRECEMSPGGLWPGCGHGPLDARRAVDGDTHERLATGPEPRRSSRSVSR